MEEKKTHRLVAKPQVSVRFLADYMAASDQARRSILRGCKYRTIARIVQHDDAKLAVSKYMLDGVGDPHILTAQAEYIRGKMTDDQFDKDCNEINAGYVERFAEVAENAVLPKGAEWISSTPFAAQSLNGVKVPFAPSLLVRRPAKNNRIRTGALFLRYKKGSKLPLRPLLISPRSFTA